MTASRLIGWLLALAGLLATSILAGTSIGTGQVSLLQAMTGEPLDAVQTTRMNHHVFGVGRSELGDIDRQRCAVGRPHIQGQLIQFGTARIRRAQERRMLRPRLYPASP